MIMARMNLTPLDDVLDKHFGKIGTPKRDAFESDVDVALHAYRLGEAIKKARIEQNLTQEQLGERIGVKRAQISRLERGYSITIPTMRRVLLQRRWEDANGNIYAKRVGTGRERYTRSTGWVNGHRLRIYYGNIVGQPYYKSYMNLVDSSRPYYARNSKGKIVPIHEVGWDSPLATPTHIIMMFSAGCGTAYEGTVGQNLYVDNVAFIYD